VLWIPYKDKTLVAEKIKVTVWVEEKSALFWQTKELPERVTSIESKDSII